MTEDSKTKLAQDLIAEGLADNEEELGYMLEDMGISLEDIENGDWF